MLVAIVERAARGTPPGESESVYAPPACVVDIAMESSAATTSRGRLDPPSDWRA
jgi:hypothetical protein